MILTLTLVAIRGFLFMNSKFLLSALCCGVFAVSALADIKDDVRQLAREKSKLTRQVSKLFGEKKLGEDTVFKELQATAFAASSAFVKARKEHPVLKSAYEASDAAQGRMVKAALAKDAEGKKAAMGDYMQARQELEKASNQLPELQELQSKARVANQAVQEKKKELLATTPEGKELAGKIIALEGKITELRKKL